MGGRLEADLVAAEKLRPRWTAAKVLAVLIAMGVHLVTLAILVAGVVLVVSLTVPGIALGALALAIAWLMRPRLGRAPKDDVVPREDAPELYRLGDEVAAALGTRPPDLIVVDEEFNASWSVVGLRRVRVLTLGLPLFDPLAPQERVALIGHELGHARNGDVRRGLVVGSATWSLNVLYGLLAPGREVQSDGDPMTALAEPITKALMYVVTRPVDWLLMLQAHLLWHDSQRAEYLADDLAARVAGTDAEVGLAEKTLQYRVFDVVARQAVNRPPGSAVDVFTESRAAMRAMPRHERERLVRAAALEGARLDATHPPTAKRIELQRQRPRQTATVVLSAAASGRIDDELAARRSDLSARIVDAYRSALYTGRRY